MQPEMMLKEIRKKLRRGYPAGELLNELKTTGYSDEAAEALMDLAATDTVRKSGISKSPNYSMLSLVGTCCLITGLAVSSFNGISSIFNNILVIGGIILLLPGVMRYLRPHLKRPE